MRILGVSLLALPYASVFLEHGVHWVLWLLLALNVLVWPHLAFLRARVAANPVKTEFRSLVLDAAFGGFWIAIAQLSVVPATAMVSILAADRLAAGGWRLLGRAGLALLCSFGFTWALIGLPFHPDASLRTMICSVPPVFCYMLALSHVSYQLARRISQQNRELDRLNRTDPALDLPNRRFFNTRAADMLAEARTTGSELALLLVDVDRFKGINDRCGHGVGDAVLRHIARVLRKMAGPDGFPARVGGDEFAVLLPGSREQGEALAAQLRRAAGRQVVHDGQVLSVSVSVGLAMLEPRHRGLDDWMGAADRAMYAAKEAGRNRLAGVAVESLDRLAGHDEPAAG